MQAPDEPVILEIEDVIDLHPFKPAEVVEVAVSYLEAAAEKGLVEVRLIHGRGKGVQRARIQAMLAKNPLVLRFQDAPASRGGHGATLVWLSPTNNSE